LFLAVIPGELKIPAANADPRSISLWDTGKKKPIFTLPLAHGIDELTLDQETKGARWITSLGHLRGTDLFASGELVAKHSR
jgi:ribosomal RNA-processing protein 9